MSVGTEKKKLLCIKDAADYLGIKLQTLYGWVNMKRIPYYKIGRFVKFDINDLNVYIDSHRVEAFKLS